MSIPSLPTELWYGILRTATHVPLLLNTEWDIEPEDRLWEGWQSDVSSDSSVRTEFPISLATKLSITLVCRTWRDLGIPLLYEVIQAPMSVDKITMLVEVMKRSVSETDVGYGRWTKRIDCDHFTLPEELFTMLDLCYNLQTFVMNRKAMIPISTQLRLAQKLQSRFSHSLRRFDFLAYDPNTNLPLKFTDTQPNIRLTSISIAVRYQLHDFPVPSSLNSISTLTIFLPITTRSFQLQWHFPNLRTLSLEKVSQSDIPALIPLIKRHSQSLRHLEITLVHHGPARDIVSLISPAVNLQSLTFSQRILRRVVDSNASPTPSFPCVTHIGVLQSPKVQYIIPSQNTISMKRLMEANIFPGLRTIRMLRGIRDTDMVQWRELGAMFERYAVRLEDMNGNLIR